MKGQITIRLAAPADAHDMAEVLMRSWEAAYAGIIPPEFIAAKNATRHALFERIITDANTNEYVIELGGKTVGIMNVDSPQYDSTDLDDSFYELRALYLHPDYQRMGIGTIAMDFAADKARRRGKTSMVLWVFAENAASIRFYEACGFAADGGTMTYDCGKAMQSVRMRRAL